MVRELQSLDEFGLLNAQKVIECYRYIHPTPPGLPDLGLLQ